MIGKFVAIIMCAAACSAQIHADCGEMEAVVRREPTCRDEPVFRSETLYTSQPSYRCRDEGMYDRELVQQRVDRRTYPVVLSNDAPETGLPPTIRAPPIVTPVRERPVIRLPHPPIPQERVLSHKCLCTKTVIKPQIIQRVITVPKIQRYLRRGYRPVIENVAYTARPRPCNEYEAQQERYVEESAPVPRGLPMQFSQVSSIC